MIVNINNIRPISKLIGLIVNYKVICIQIIHDKDMYVLVSKKNVMYYKKILFNVKEIIYYK